MARHQEPAGPAAEEPFLCIKCNRLVLLPAGGTGQRNHCPHCLWSLHVDFRSGDRHSVCRSPMEPIAVWAKPGGEWAVVHRCESCGTLRANRIAGDDNEGLLLSLALRPLSRPAFPVERLKLGE